MNVFKYRWVPIAGLLVAAVVAAGCQSVATTSAKLRNQEGNYDLAIDLAKQAIAENPADAEAYFQMGFAYSKLDSVSLAYQHFMKSMELDPRKKNDALTNIQSNFAKHYKLGQGAFKRKDYERAADEFDNAAKADPDRTEAYYNLGVAYSRLANDDSTYNEKVISTLDKVFELSNPNESHYIKALEVAGRAFVNLGREKEAKNRFNRLVEEDPTSFSVIENLGNDLLKAKQWKGAAEFLKLSAEARRKIGSEDFTVYYNIGTALYQTRKEDPSVLDESIGYYQRALDLQPDEPQTVFNIVVAFVAKEDWRNAVDWGEKYIRIRPADHRGWQLLARCYSELGEKDKAREAMERFQQLRQSGG